MTSRAPAVRMVWAAVAWTACGLVTPIAAEAQVQVIDTPAGTVTVKAIPGQTTQAVLEAALLQLQAEREPLLRDDPRAIVELRQAGATLVLDVYGNIASLSFSKTGSQTNDPQLAAKFTDKQAAYLVRLTSIRTLNLNFTGVTNEGLKSIAHLESLANLQLASTGVNDEGLAALAELSALRYLDLGSCQITGAGLPDLAASEHLLSINLSSTPLDDEGVAKLVALTSLRRVYLTGTKITNASIPLLAKLPELKVLSLYATRISDAAVQELAEFPALETLYLEQSLVTAQGARWLQQKLPKLQIYGP